jgi:hypothetical protein
MNTRISERVCGYVEGLPQQVSSPRTHVFTGPHALRATGNAGSGQA